MAIDSKAKRISALNFCQLGDALPVADASIAQADRWHVAGFYGGVLGEAPVDYDDRHAAALEIRLTGVRVKHLVAVGTVGGVVIDRVAGRNGPGIGMLRAEGYSADAFAWRAPGSATFGPARAANADGYAVLEDGEDADKFVRVKVYSAFLSRTPNAAAVFLRDVYNNAVGHDDVTAGEATAGDVATYTISLTNVSGARIYSLRAWLDAAVSGLEISDDGATWVNPTTEATALRLSDLDAEAEDTLHLRRTIGAGASCDAGILNLIHLSFAGV